ncbi:MAG: hypothetical protein HYZ84_03545 [Candidatus Omnitrophica bacterium]|nr:hypothetical protein [Candidatus Omnitrophota bacterium]
MIQWFVKDSGIKLISFLLAIGLWYYAVGEEGVEITRTVPLKIKIKNPQMSVLSVSSPTVDVTLQAPRALLNEMTSNEIYAEHEIRDEAKTAGDYSFRLEPGEVKTSKNEIRVVRIQPPVIGVRLDELIVQKLEIKPNFVGEPAVGYQVMTNEIQLNPNAILLQGPKGELEKLSFVKTENMHLVGRIRSFRITAGLELPENVKPLSEALVDAYIPIKEESAEKNFENIPVLILKPLQKGLQVEIVPPAVSFTLRGSRSQLDKLSSEQVQAYVDLTALESGTHDVPLKMLLPPDVGLKDEPLIVKVTLKK